ncbi:hypothetical protein KAR91_29375 [Candidatus Pacearchaeota archaeon]|nr:hypothetical protein [Candidatus Pacearchaeota archaeon]
MSKKKRSFTSIALSVLNLKQQEEEQDDDEKKMPELLRDLYDGMKASEDATTMTMALVGQKRVALRKLVEKQDGLKAKAIAMERENRGDLARNYVAQYTRLDSEIERVMGEVGVLDVQATNEIAHFQQLEKDADRLKSEIARAEQVDVFNKIRQRVSNTSSGFSESVVAQIERKVEKIDLESAQLAAKAVLNSGDVESLMFDHEADQILADQELEIAYLELQEEAKSSSELPEGEKSKILEAPVDKARQLLNAPAFSGVLRRK